MIHIPNIHKVITNHTVYVISVLHISLEGLPLQFTAGIKCTMHYKCCIKPQLICRIVAGLV